MVECTALEMRHTCKGIVGSNPTLSAITCLRQAIFPAIFELMSFDASAESGCGQAPGTSIPWHYMKPLMGGWVISLSEDRRRAQASDA